MGRTRHQIRMREQRKLAKELDPNQPQKGLDRSLNNKKRKSQSNSSETRNATRAPKRGTWLAAAAENTGDKQCFMVRQCRHHGMVLFKQQRNIPRCILCRAYFNMRSSGREMTLSRLDQLQIIERQRGMCALCGDEVLWNTLLPQEGEMERGGRSHETMMLMMSNARHPRMVSWDRIDVREGYSLANVQVCHVECNVRRQNLSMVAFYNLARLVCKREQNLSGNERQKLVLSFLKECNLIDMDTYEDEVTKQMQEGSALTRTAAWGIFYLESRFCRHHDMDVIFRSARKSGPFRCILCEQHRLMKGRNRTLHRVNGMDILKCEMTQILRSQAFQCAICRGSLLVRGQDLQRLIKEFFGAALKSDSDDCSREGSNVTCHKRHMLTLSWDRKRCDMGYIRENVQAVHYICNKVKNDLDNEQLEAWLGQCLAHGKKLGMVK